MNCEIEARIPIRTSMRTFSHHQRQQQRPMLIEQIVQALSGLEFGAVEITVHHGRIVQIERREKVRLEDGRTRTVPQEPTGSPEVLESTNFRDPLR